MLHQIVSTMWYVVTCTNVGGHQPHTRDCDTKCRPPKLFHAQAEPIFPRAFGGGAVEHEGFPVCTVQVRAPEMAFGDVGFGRPIDMWSLGVVVMNMCGQLANMSKLEKHPPRWGYLVPIAVRWIGAPPKTVFPNYPMPPPAMFSKIVKPVLDKGVIATLGDDGVDLVMQLLQWDPNEAHPN